MGDHWSRRAPPADHRSWSHSRFLVLGRAERADPPLSQFQVIGQLSGRPAFQGPLFEQSGQQATGPSDHRPRPNRSARTSRPTPHRNTTAPPHPRPPTRAITSSVITYRSCQIQGIHRQLNTPHAHDRGRCPSGRERPRAATHPCCTHPHPVFRLIQPVITDGHRPSTSTMRAWHDLPTPTLH